LALPFITHAGEIASSDGTAGFQWKSTDCRLPIAASPSPDVSNQDRLMRYAFDIETYIDCIQREAQRDFEIAQRELQAAIERDLKKQTDIMNSMMLQAAKTMR
jgi:hypothetical protein